MGPGLDAGHSHEVVKCWRLNHELHGKAVDQFLPHMLVRQMPATCGRGGASGTAPPANVLPDGP